MCNPFIPRWRCLFLAGCLSLALCVVMGRLFFLHVMESDRLGRIVVSNRQNFQVINARRGNIVDVRGNLLAATQLVYEVGLDPQNVDFERDKAKLPELARLLNVSEDLLRERAATRTREVNGPDGPEIRDIRWHKIAESVDVPVYKSLLELGVKGVYGNITYERNYPSSELAAHVLGYLNKENKAVMGVEQYLDFYLRGQDGWRQSERDGRRRELAQFRSREIPAADGMNVQLTIDAVIQHIVEEELRAIAADYTPKSAVIIVSEPRTGDILALANYPTFDPNRFGEAPLENQRNRAITDVYEPGSTFKIVPIGGALNEGLVRGGDLFNCTLDSVPYRGRNVRLPADHHPLGTINVRRIVEQSSNRGSAQIGIKLGEERLYAYAKAFGFGSRTGYGPSGEVNGTLHPIRNWDGLTISRLPIGHAVSATPMQVHYAMGAIANGGVLVEPRIVRRVFDQEGRDVVEFLPRARERVLSGTTAQTLTDMLVGVVGKEGTAGRAAIPGFRIAGKTGTTKKIVNGRYSSQHHIASFVGFFPAEQPRIVVTVVVDEPVLKGSGYGGIVAAPAFRHISEQIIQYLGIKPADGERLVAMKGGDLDWLRSN